MINGDNKKPERGSHPAIVADAATEAQRIAAALARAEMRVPSEVQQAVPAEAQKGPNIAVNPPSAKPAIPAEEPHSAQSQRNMGFDPYNSGGFDRKHAWSRVGKR